MNSKKKLVVRVDGNSSLGLGHIYRGLALASMVNSTFDIEFAVRADSAYEIILQHQFPVHKLAISINRLDEPYYLMDKYGSDTLLAMDGYAFDETYQKMLKDLNFTLVYIDDVAQGTQYADLLINHSPGAILLDYSCASTTRMALGLNYALLRKGFLRKNTLPYHADQIHCVFVSLGGSKQTELLHRVIEALIGIQSIHEIHVISAFTKDLEHLAAHTKKSIHIYRDLNENQIIELLKKSDAAFVPSSTLSLEAAALGVPLITGYFVDNQKNIYEGWMQSEVGLGLGNLSKYNFENFKQALNAINNPSSLLKFRNNLSKLFDTGIEENILAEILSIC
jgi:UDP-2,4-diacetamido-2,4,6-trideoxy-beta-L-altropyranose hydrolase